MRGPAADLKCVPPLEEQPHSIGLARRIDRLRARF